MNHHPRPNPTRGYTLIEVLIVVAILGVVSAAVVPSMLAAGTMGVQAAARVIVADLLYAQNEAIAHQATRAVVFEPDENRYRLVDENEQTLTASWINGKANNYLVNFSNDSRFEGVTLVSADFGDGHRIAYDDIGTPTTGGTVLIEYGEHEYRIDVASFTGRVTVTRLDE